MPPAAFFFAATRHASCFDSAIFFRYDFRHVADAAAIFSADFRLSLSLFRAVFVFRRLSPPSPLLRLGYT